jgi:hypothetical protein
VARVALLSIVLSLVTAVPAGAAVTIHFEPQGDLTPPMWIATGDDASNNIVVRCDADGRLAVDGVGAVSARCDDNFVLLVEGRLGDDVIDMSAMTLEPGAGSYDAPTRAQGDEGTDRIIGQPLPQPPRRRQSRRDPRRGRR